MNRLRLGAAAVVACAAVAGPLVAACGGSTLAEPAPCTAPTPTPTPQPRPGQTSSSFQFVQRVEAGTRRLTEMLATFRAAWPDTTFYRNGPFREDFVNYAGRAICLAQDLKALAPPAGRFETFRTAFPPLMDEYIATQNRGIEAIRQRNTSEYRDWARDIDAIEVRVAAAVQQLKDERAPN